MRLLVVSNLYPPVAVGGYEAECAAAVEHLRSNHDVEVLTSSREHRRHARESGVVRELALLTADWRGALRAPLAAPAAVRSARRALDKGPDLIYVWNGAGIPHAALRVLVDSGVPVAFRVCEHWFAGLFTGDQFMRELLPGSRRLPRTIWAQACRLVNTLPSLRLTPTAPVRAAVSWNSRALQALVANPPFVEAVLERVIHAVPPRGELYAALERRPAESPEIVFVGRVTPYKGVHVAIEALARLREEHGVAARLLVIGPEDAAYGRELRTLAGTLGVGGQVRFRGELAPADAADALAGASALIVPSTWQEPLGLVMIEGAFARVPLVASDVGGISEAMSDERHALLFPPGDASAAAGALARVLSDPRETEARVARAYERAQAFRLGPYLAEQERFLLEAHALLSGT